MKICTKCKTEKEEENFSRRSDRNKLSSWCKLCVSKANVISARNGRADKAYSRLKSNPNLMKKYRDRQKELQILNRAKYLLIVSRSRAKKKGLEFNISEEDLKIPEYCPILKTPFPKGSAMMDKKNWYTSTVDRIDNNKGYVKGNVMIISRKANVMKNSASEEELLTFCNYFLKQNVNGKKV